MSPPIPFVLYRLRNVSKYCNWSPDVFTHLSKDVVAARKISKACYTLVGGARDFAEFLRDKLPIARARVATGTLGIAPAQKSL